MIGRALGVGVYVGLPGFRRHVGKGRIVVGVTMVVVLTAIVIMCDLSIQASVIARRDPTLVSVKISTPTISLGDDLLSVSVGRTVILVLRLMNASTNSCVHPTRSSGTRQA